MLGAVLVPLCTGRPISDRSPVPKSQPGTGQWDQQKPVDGNDEAQVRNLFSPGLCLSG